MYMRCAPPGALTRARVAPGLFAPARSGRCRMVPMFALAMESRPRRRPDPAEAQGPEESGPRHPPGWTRKRAS